MLPGGGLSSQARLEMMARYNATALCCTPTYALRLGESIGAPSGVNLDQLSVKRIIVAGEPGGSLPTTRERIRQLWGGAKLFDHHGMSEVGPVSYEDPEMPASLCVIEDSYFAEVVDSAGNEVPTVPKRTHPHNPRPQCLSVVPLPHGRLGLQEDLQ